MLAKLLLSSVVFGTLFITVAGQPQTPLDEKALDSISSHLQAIKLKTGTNDREAGSLCQSIEDLVTALKATHQKLRSDDSGPALYTTSTINGRQVLSENEVHTATITADYISSLHTDDELLRRLAESNVKSDELHQTLSDVKEDLEIKLSYLRAGQFVEVKTVSVATADPSETVTTYESQIGDVAVVVKTKRGDGTVVPGYEVYYVEKGLAKDPSRPPKSFATLSTTDSQKLPPGAYFMWTVKGGKKTSPRLVPIGSKGSPESVDLSVPNN
jgi:hypothetical protein